MAEEKKYNIPGPLHPFVTTQSMVVRSPGRINLIGEHTDYNEGFVLPAAIDKAVYVSAEKITGNKMILHSVDFNESVEMDLAGLRPHPGHWSTYIAGVANQLMQRGKKPGGFRMSVYGDVPLGAGLSSSAAIECAAAFALNELFALSADRLELAKMAQAAEHLYAGVKCGIMDQFASLFGKKDKVIKLDCRSFDYEYFPVNLEGYQLWLFDTQVKHSLASSEYNLRREQCEKAVAMIQQQHPQVKSLRDVSLEMTEELSRRAPVLYKRARYVVDENTRLQEGCEDLQKGDIGAFGKKMFATHMGLSRQYEVSCAELDFLVETVMNRPEVAGARMMGGGFGGCTLNIIAEAKAAELVRNSAAAYNNRFQKEMKAYRVRIEEGTSVIN